MTLDQTIGLLALVTLVEMMVAVGLSTSLADFVGAATDGRLVARAVVANYVLVPAATVGLLLLFRAPPMVAVGFLTLAVCPGGPYGPAYTGIARGSAGAAAGLMVVLVGTSAVVSPALLRTMARPLAGDQPLDIDVVRMTVTLLLGQVLPLLVGLAVSRWRPGVARRLVRPARWGATVLNVVFLAVVLVAQYQILLRIKPLAWVGMLALLVSCMVIGWLAGGPGVGGRRAMALTTAVRNNGVGMVIVTGAFPGTAAVTAAMIYGLVGFLGSLLLALWWARRGSEPKAPAPPIGRVAVGTGG
jgi:BASS family bile acid:Na+ symporter